MHELYIFLSQKFDREEIFLLDCGTIDSIIGVYSITQKNTEEEYHEKGTCSGARTGNGICLYSMRRQR